MCFFASLKPVADGEELSVADIDATVGKLCELIATLRNDIKCKQSSLVKAVDQENTRVDLNHSGGKQDDPASQDCTSDEEEFVLPEQLARKILEEEDGHFGKIFKQTYADSLELQNSRLSEQQERRLNDSLCKEARDMAIEIGASFGVDTLTVSQADLKAVAPDQLTEVTDFFTACPCSFGKDALYGFQARM